MNLEARLLPPPLLTQALSAHSNHLTTLEGLSGLSALRELNLKDNYLGSQTSGPNQTLLVSPSLPLSLQTLHLDSNGFTDMPPFLKGVDGGERGGEGTLLPQLRLLGLANNEIRGLGEPLCEDL